MVLICKDCDTSWMLEIVDAWEQETDDGFVEKFRETYECQLCGGRGILYADSTGGTDKERLTGILSTRPGY